MGGKSSAPPPPDYEGAARATAQGNLEATRYATEANRINQFTPYGSLTYRQTPSTSVDYDAYDKAMADYNRKVDEAYRNAGLSSMGSQTQPSREQFMSQFRAPNVNDFSRTSTAWEQNVTLTPEAQAALDQQLALNRKYGETANVGFDRVRQLFENPQLDTSGLPTRGIDVGQTAQQAIMSRLQPQLAQQEESLRARLANQGIGLGSEAYGREQMLASQRRNDLEMQAALQGISLDQANRAAALQEQAYMQDRPLNLINALRSGNQVVNPQFQQFYQQQVATGPDLSGAAQQQYQANLGASNASSAASSGLMSGLFGIGGAALGGMMGNPLLGAQLGAGLGASLGR